MQLKCADNGNVWEILEIQHGSGVLSIKAYRQKGLIIMPRKGR